MSLDSQWGQGVLKNRNVGRVIDSAGIVKMLIFHKFVLSEVKLKVHILTYLISYDWTPLE